MSIRVLKVIKILLSSKNVKKRQKKLVRQAKRRFENKLSLKENTKLFNSYVQVRTKSRSGVGSLSQDGCLVSDKNQWQTC